MGKKIEGQCTKPNTQKVTVIKNRKTCRSGNPQKKKFSITEIHEFSYSKEQTE